MAKKELGRASYSAHRFGNLTYLTASGTLSYLTDKVDFEYVPTFLPPSYYAFYVIHAAIGLPVTMPFTYTEPVVFPTTAKSVHILDAGGVHVVPIYDLPMPATEGAASVAADTSRDNCVFSWIGINHLLVAKCDAILPAVYTRVFGPDTLDACRRYVMEHTGGIAA